MYQASVPVFVRGLASLATVLEKADAYAAARKIEPAVLIGSRLFPDMFALGRQVQIATDAAKGAAARLAEQPPPSYPDDEATFPQLIERCRKTIAYLETLKPGQIDGSEERTVTWQTRAGPKSMAGLPYLLHQATPNFYFHVTTAYDILRHNGVEIGKQDFLGRS